MTRPTWLIGGGYDKNSEYEEWIQAFDGKVKGLVLIGATREKIRAAAERCGFTACAYADSLDEAITWCRNAGHSPGMRCCCHRPAPAGACSRTMRNAEKCSRTL